jgi:hypothetical protein
MHPGSSHYSARFAKLVLRPQPTPTGFSILPVLAGAVIILMIAGVFFAT